MTPAERVLVSVLTSNGWTPGTSLENRVAWRLHRFGVRPTECVQQLRVGRYRIDFGFPAIRLALEADGWHHQRPDMAARDAIRDRVLRRQGWLVLRVNDEQDEAVFQEQIVRIAEVVHALSPPRRGRRSA